MQKILFALALIAGNYSASAQAIIPFVGGNLSWYQVKGDHISSKPVVGINAGAVADIRLSSMFSWQAGLQYSLTGGKIVSTLASHVPQHDSSVYRVHALQLPVMLVLKIGDEDRGRFFAGAGFYVSANLGGTRYHQHIRFGSGSLVIVDRDKSSLGIGTSETSNIRRYDFGLNLGAGYHLSNGFELYGFYQKGAVDVLTGYYGTGSRSFQAGLSVRYALKLSKQKAAHNGPR